MKKQHIAPKVTILSFTTGTEMLGTVSGVVNKYENGDYGLDRWQYKDTDDEGFEIGTKPHGFFDDEEEE